ncbi:hypothetical protein GCM10009007_08110 [Formosimonas limnophila]|uniref:Uncharacterized protein n=1 Tax=Formosimonas limnophila TaxID=1384487 RepID=A0A8J3G064_9BURK|nr:hypothetical protein GCM10009007_08110 [Formosimonas limnophila]
MSEVREIKQIRNQLHVMLVFLAVLSLCIAPHVEFRYTAKVLNLNDKYYVPTAWNELQHPD